MRELFTCGCLLLLCCIKEIIGVDPRSVLFHGRERENWAWAKPTCQSSTLGYSWFRSSHAVDGSLANDVKFRSCTHTRVQTHAWWIVDLIETIRVKEVFIMNRGDCCGNRTRNFHIDVHKGNISALQLVGLCHYQSEPLKSGMAKSFRCPYELIGHFVRLWIDYGNVALSVCEIEVYGARYRQYPRDGQWALNMPASQSTRLANVSNASNASNAVDGNYNNTFSAGSCSHTEYGDMKPWWQVDLLQMLIVTSVKLYNRGDLGEDRLHDFQIDVLAHANDTDPQKCNEQTGSPMGHSFKYKCLQHLLGRIVRVTKTIVNGNLDVLSLCEVEVYGNKLVSDPEYLKSRDNIALFYQQWQSAGPDTGARAVDGNMVNNAAAGSCSMATRDDRGSTWWKVHFGWLYIEAVLIVFRVDCCENQASHSGSVGVR
ncbi:uncharacterized protein LOC121377464 isoform X1 [Gigantopelta aegis]|uniref:uncharacterized protein LOC121377464 isoform X1 n=1 Tax=Gigantopelta aegis TaxID=1735272 RepID=UPI001B88A07B|nr:uncharacterized protein LOC121377464 isoform X1 [Gigantopelta aegis]XP_041361396.1 uncharacterized protein LOC121377464 isoform X1 [Gigantopelta aegis]